MLFRKESKNTASSGAVAKHYRENGVMESQQDPEAFSVGGDLVSPVKLVTAGQLRE